VGLAPADRAQCPGLDVPKIHQRAKLLNVVGDASKPGALEQ
jgi:hypothetical protein